MIREYVVFHFQDGATCLWCGEQKGIFYRLPNNPGNRDMVHEKWKDTGMPDVAYEWYCEDCLWKTGGGL